MDIEKKGNEKDIEEIIALLDGYVKSEGSRLKIQVTEGEGKVIDKKYHHGRCDVGSPWAKGEAFDLCE
ncbi:MAG: hypothetical protein IKC46_07100 [Lachnospiraceae bacterium]|nr:hypothetical protein [Lachnospiraceae bacterium]